MPRAPAAAAKKPPKSRAEYDLPPAVWVATSELKPWIKNPRRNDHVVDDVAESMKRFGFGAPLVARLANGEIIAGHTRLKAALKLKFPQVPVRYLDLSEKEAHLLAAADNRLGEKAQWDERALLELLSEYAPGDRTLAGWSDKDLAALERAAKIGNDVVEDEPPPVPKVPITKPGDVWQLGRHRLICGDSTKPETYERLLHGRRVGLMATDPPYGVEAKTGTRNPFSPAYKKGEARNRSIENDELKKGDLEEFLRAAFEACAPTLSPGASWYIWFAGTHSREFIAATDQLGGFKHQLVWIKGKFVFGRSDYHYKHEPCLYGWTLGAAHTWLGSRDQCSVFELKLDKAVGELVHPSVKPVELYAIPIRNHLGADGAVLDIFAGTGPAFSAAEQLDRICYGIELAPGYCDVIVQRWEKLSGQGATRESGARRAQTTQG